MIDVEIYLKKMIKLEYSRNKITDKDLSSAHVCEMNERIV